MFTLILDNASVVQLLGNCIRKASAKRQVIIVTHNPNRAVFCDADQVICCTIDKPGGHRIEYKSGAIEDYPINQITVYVLEGTYPAFDNRGKKYHKPVEQFGPIVGRTWSGVVANNAQSTAISSVARQALGRNDR